ncbi:MAG: YSC84-related protein [Burkholderiales bacterium]|nr:YSC84-related protein [Burkholderiales bacterium]
MTVRTLAAAICAAVLLGTGSAPAHADAAKQRAEIERVSRDALTELYRKRPEAKAKVEKAAGYGVFTTYGLSFILGGSGGKGVVHDNAGGKDTYMNVAQASAGPQLGVQKRKVVIVFNDRKAMQRFIDSGWEAGGGGRVGAAVGGKGAQDSEAEMLRKGMDWYNFTDTGIEAGGAISGMKFWKDAGLN